MPEYVYVNAGNDRNGNARRGWIEYREGQRISFYDEGCIGISALPEQALAVASFEPLQVTPGEYRRLLNLVRSGIPTL